MDNEELGRQLHHKLDHHYQNIKDDHELLSAKVDKGFEKLDKVHEEVKDIKVAITFGNWEARIANVESRLNRLEKAR